MRQLREVLQSDASLSLSSVVRQGKTVEVGIDDLTGTEVRKQHLKSCNATIPRRLVVELMEERDPELRDGAGAAPSDSASAKT